MKKNISLLLLLSSFVLVSCGGTSSSGETTKQSTEESVTTTGDTTQVATTTQSTASEQQVEPSIVYPAGTPALGLANYLVDHVDSSTVVDASGLIAEFSKGAEGSDIIVSPVNVGVKMYNTNAAYKLFKTFVWGNLFIISKNASVKSFADLDGKKVGYFGTQTATPYIVTTALMKNKNITISLEAGASTVSELTPLFVNGTYDTIITAEPVLSGLKLKGVVNDSVTIIDLQNEYKLMNGTNSYPQAGIFVNSESYGSYFKTAVLDKMVDAINKANTDPTTTAKNALKLSVFSTSNEAILTKAIPGSNFNIITDYTVEKTQIDSYLDILSSQNLGNTYGNTKPSEEFYIH